MAEVVFESVSKRFGAVLAVDRLDLEVSDEEFLVLLGPSGCGKTTALRMVAGLDEPSEGLVRIGDQIVNDVEPRDRDVAMVFQSYALYPHLTVRRNIEFPLRARKVERADRDRAVQEAASTLGLNDLMDRKPAQLSGGQRQRVALARALVRRPTVFLMDEPLSNLDAKLRVQARADVVQLQHQLKTTALYVTHDQLEAMAMADRVAVMNEGRLQQVGTPMEVYERPANVFVARFIGSPPMNTIEGRLTEERPSALVVSGGEVPLAPIQASIAAHSGTKALVAGLRPEELAVGPSGTLAASATLVEPLGHLVQVVCKTADGTQLVIQQPASSARPRPGENLQLSIDPERVHLFRSDTGARL